MTIATNIFSLITSEDKKEIINSLKAVDNVEFFEYSEKALPIDETTKIIKFIFDDLDLFKIVRDGILFNVFCSGINKLWKLAKNKIPNSEIKGKIEFSSIELNLPEDDIGEALDALPYALEKIEEDKSYLLIFEKGQWTIKVL